MPKKIGFRGDTYSVPMNAGMNANPNTDAIPPENKADIKNCNMNEGGLSTRGGVTKVDPTAVSGASQIMGGFQFRLKNGTESIITGATNGTIQKNYHTELKTGLTTGKNFEFEVLNDLVYICNSANTPMYWNGVASGVSNVTGLPTDWTGSNFPKKFIKHGKGVSESLWAFGCPTTPNTIYVSKNGTADFTNANVTLLQLETGDGHGIVAGVEFVDNFFAFGKKNTYIIDDSSATRTNWGYTLAPWTGGAAHDRLVCKTPNDVVVMTEDGEVYTISTVQEYGDYKSASLTIPSHFDQWIKDNLDLSKIAQFSMIWDDKLKAVRIFGVRQGQTQVDVCLLFFPDKGVENGWCYHQYASAIGSCVFPVRVSASVWSLYVGGYDGFIRSLENTTFNDDSVYYYNGFTTPYISLGSIRQIKHFLAGWISLYAQGTETITVKISVDGSDILNQYEWLDESGNNIVDENGVSVWGNSAETFQVTVSSATHMQNLKFRIGKVGTRIKAEVYNENINTSFLISQMMFDFEALEARIST